MDTHFFQIGDENDGDVILRLICSDGVEYEGNPLHLHSHVLNKSKFFQARLSERWSSHSSSPPEIKLSVPVNGVAENYIKCIRLMYSSDKAKGLYFSDVDEALDIFPVASYLLFEEGIEACMNYLEAVPWTPQQLLKIKTLISSPQVSVSADLSARIGISNSSFSGELELLKKKLPKMFSTMWRNQVTILSLRGMRLTIEQQLIEIFQGNAFPAMQEVCRDSIIREFSLEIECITNDDDSACENLLWLLDTAKLCNIGAFEITLKMLVEDSERVNRLLPNGSIYGGFSFTFSNNLLQILVDRYLKGLANGCIIVPKCLRISFLKMWVPVIAYHTCRMVSKSDWFLKYPENFVGGVTKVVGTLPLDDQKVLFMFWTNSLERFGAREKETFQWWIDAIWLAVTSANSIGIGTE